MMPATYPTRPSYFAHRVTRLALKTCLAQEIGPAGALLVVFVAHVEDAKRYTAPPTFYNEQLLPLLGLRKWKTLDRIRRDAAAAGWLHYEPPASGTRRPGTYWALIPDRFAGIDDQPTDEDADRMPERDTLDPKRMPKTDTVGAMVGDTVGGNLPTLVPEPIPGPQRNKSKLRFDAADDATAQWMFEKILALDAGAKEPHFGKWAHELRLIRERDGRTDQEIRTLFEWANQDSFWCSNVLCPGSLRKHWGKLSAQMKTRGNGRQHRGPKVDDGSTHPADAANRAAAVF